MEIANQYPNNFSLKGGWGRVFKLGVFGYPILTFILFLTGLISTILEIASFGVLVIGIKLLGDNSVIDFFGYQLAGPLSVDQIITGLIIFTALQFLSITGIYGLAFITARIRRNTFKDLIETSLNKFVSNPDHPFLIKLGLRGLPRILRRETRYASRSISSAMQLPMPVLTLAIIVITGIYLYPIPVGIALTLLLVSLPFHYLMSKWGSNMMSKMLNTGSIKSRLDKEVIEKLFSSPFQNKEKSVKSMGYTHANSTPVKDFLEAYVSRVKLGPISQIITKVTFVAIFCSVGIILLRQYINEEIDLASITILIFGARLFNTSFATMAQSVTVIASYHPLTSDFLEFIYGDAEKSLKYDYNIDNHEKYLPNRTILIANIEPNWHAAQQISLLWRKPKRPLQIITGRYGNLPKNIDPLSVQEALNTIWSGLSKNVKNKIGYALDRGANASEEALALIALWYTSLEQPKSNIVWDSRSFTRLAIPDRDLIINWIRNRRLIVYYVNPPKGVPLLEQFSVWVMIEQNFKRICEPKQYREKQAEIVTLLNNASNNTLEDIELDIDIN